MNNANLVDLGSQVIELHNEKFIVSPIYTYALAARKKLLLLQMK